MLSLVRSKVDLEESGVCGYRNQLNVLTVESYRRGWGKTNNFLLGLSGEVFAVSVRHVDWCLFWEKFFLKSKIV